jgi:hypothetical protein
MSNTFPNKSTKISVLVFPRVLFCFIAFSGVSQRWAMGVQKHNKKTSSKKGRVEGLFKRFDQKPKADVRCFCDFVLILFWAFHDEEISKTRPKTSSIEKMNPTPVPVLFGPLTHPPTTIMAVAD